ncbi:biotin/lipoyl-binding protein [Rhizobium sullae]|nr:biotin/lipoyl-binding protein [Rhizobium sullae]
MDAHEKEDNRSFLRRHPLMVILVIGSLLLLSNAGYFIWLVYFRPYETTDDAFVDARSFSVAAKVSGYVSEVAVTDNQHVMAGDAAGQTAGADTALR